MIPLKYSRSVMLGSAESEQPRLISHKIIFEVFQPMWPRYLNVTGVAILRSAEHRVVKIKNDFVFFKQHPFISFYSFLRKSQFVESRIKKPTRNSRKRNFATFEKQSNVECEWIQTEDEEDFGVQVKVLGGQYRVKFGTCLENAGRSTPSKLTLIQRQPRTYSLLISVHINRLHAHYNNYYYSTS